MNMDEYPEWVEFEDVKYYRDSISKTTFEEIAKKERLERIATAALQGLLSNPNDRGKSEGFGHYAVWYAARLIEALDGNEQA